MSDIEVQAPPSEIPRAGENGAKKLSEKQKNELLTDINKKFDGCKNSRINFEKDWYYNLAFYFGRQWVEWVGTSTANLDFYKLYEPPAPSWRVRLVSNKIRPIIRNELTKLTKERYQSYVLPNTTDDSDVSAARAAEHISEYLMDESNFTKKERQVVFWALACGTSFFKTYFDPTLPDSSGMLGKICVDDVNAFHLFAPDLEAEEIEDQPYLIHASCKQTDWVKDTFDVDVEAGQKTSGISIEQKFFSALGVKTAEANRDLVYVKEIWLRPCRKYPNGALVIWTSEEILGHYDYWPYSHKEYPFAKVDHIPTGRFYADSVIKDLIPLQKEYNRSISQLVEAKNRMAKPQLIAPKGSVDPAKMTSEPGLIITYQPGFQPPTPIPLTQMPSYVLENIQRIAQDMDDISGQYEVTKGRTPPGVEAASAIAYLQEENDTRLAHTVASIEEAIEKVGHQMLALANDYWDAQRLVKVVGTNNLMESFQYSKADISGNTDFRVQSGSSAPRSRAAKQAFLTEIGKLGWLPPDKILRYLDLVETDKLYEDTQVSARHAQRENLKMQEMQPQQPQTIMDPETNQPFEAPMPAQFPVNDWDDDTVHVDEHTRYMRTQQFEVLDPQIQEVFKSHLAMHKQRLQSMQMMMGAGQGMPGQVPPQPQENLA